MARKPRSGKPTAPGRVVDPRAAGRHRPEAGPCARQPEVLLAFQGRDGMLYVVLANVGEGSAHAVRTSFRHAFRGLGGRKAIHTMGLFRRLSSSPRARRSSSSWIPAAPASSAASRCSRP
jgi:hypothetical protein